MCLFYAIELVLAAGVGLALVRYQQTDPDYQELGGFLTGIVRLEDGIDVFFAGVALVGGMGILVERARGRSPRNWGPGRWIWVIVASYLLLHVLDAFCGTLSAHIWAVGVNQASLVEDLLRGLRWKYGRYLLPSISWFTLALAMTSLLARPQLPPAPDARDRAGTVFAVLLIFCVLVLKVFILFGYQEGTMGGGMSWP
jgi:hypothetical protein